MRPDRLIPRIFLSEESIGEWMTAPRRFLLAIGKAAISSASAVLNQAECTDLFVLSPAGIPDGNLPQNKIHYGSHPVPDNRSIAATKELLVWLENVPPHSELLVLLSGGSSALLVSPPAGISADSKFELNRLLLGSGASIHEMNSVRKHCSAVKGGRLGELCRHLKTRVFAISDVIGDDLAVIGSGPFYPDHTTFLDARDVLQKYGVWSQVPEEIRIHLESGISGSLAETPKPGGSLAIPHTIVASNDIARKAAAKKAEAFGHSSHLPEALVSGFVEEAAEFIAGLAMQCPPNSAVILGGEVTVRLKGNGRGGRNQHLALLVAQKIQGKPLFFAAAGTDGVDGNSEAAGAWVNGDTVTRAEKRGLNIYNATAEFNSYPFFRELNQCIVTGPTGTNVMDLYIILT